jgi:RpiR family carbohydrate utilization transcriptional regulator
VAYADAYIHNVAASLLKPGDVVVAISNSGRSKDLLYSVDLALAAGAEVLAITASGSPLAQRATLALTIDVTENSDNYSPIKARIAPMVVIDILAIGVALGYGPSVIERLAGIRTILQEKFI